MWESSQPRVRQKVGAGPVKDGSVGERQRRPLQKGFTLIEVLVSTLVLSIGLIGIGGLILFGMKAVHSSMQSSMASVIALDVEEWLWEALVDDRLTSCADARGVTRAVGDRWFGRQEVGGILPLTLPGGSVDLDVATCVHDTGGQFGCTIRARIDVTWSESRFDEGETESFGYWIQVPCTGLGT